MTSCCDSPADRLSPIGTFTVALAGNPNSGKTTIFNGLTGLRQHVANYPGVTVEKKTGRCKLPAGGADQPARWIDVIDLPGTYSLISRSPDEQVAMEVLRGLRPDTPPPDAVIVVVDASNLQRNLYLVSQLVELGRPLVVALNMMDVAERRGIKVSPESLQRELGVPVIPLVGHKKKGIDELKRAIAKAAVAPMPNWPLPEAMKEELLLVGGGLAILGSKDEGGRLKDERDAAPTDPSAFILQPSSLLPAPRAWICRDDSGRTLDRYQAIAERLLIGDHAADVANLATRQPVASLLNAAMTRLQSLGIDPMQADIEAHYRWIEGVAARASTPPEHLSVAIEPGGSQILPYESKQSRTLTQKVDAILVHKVWGLLIFAAIMGALFVSIFWLAKPIMDGISTGIDALGAWTAHSLSEGPVKSLITDGIFKGVGAVVVFVPQIAMLFLFLAILEDTGYLARAAFLMDRLLAKVGLHGKSFIPLLSSFACAIPGIMATRTIENRKDRLATIFIAPFMSCSARLPVYTLLIGAFFAQYSALARGGIMLGCYALGIIAAVITAWIFKRSFLKGPAQAFILELPTYKLPQLSQIARQVWVNTSKFLTKAGTTIFCLSVILWALSFYPRMPESHVAQLTRDVTTEADALVCAGGPDTRARIGEGQYQFELADKLQGMLPGRLAAAQSEYSLAGRFGHTIEPAIRPLGFDWKMGVGLVGAFAAREVFVSTMGITYSVGGVEDDTASLADAMRADRYADGRPVWTPLVAISLLVWFVLAMQCMSTMAIVRRETGGWRWPIIMLVYMNALAYVASLAVFQLGSLFLRA
jgi:ferrous iron transport protein B